MGRLVHGQGRAGQGRAGHMPQPCWEDPLSGPVCSWTPGIFISLPLPLSLSPSFSRRQDAHAECLRAGQHLDVVGPPAPGHTVCPEDPRGYSNISGKLLYLLLLGFAPAYFPDPGPLQSNAATATDSDSDRPKTETDQHQPFVSFCQTQRQRKAYCTPPRQQ